MAEQDEKHEAGFEMKNESDCSMRYELRGVYCLSI